jgi:hypothetical protein
MRFNYTLKLLEKELMQTKQIMNHHKNLEHEMYASYLFAEETIKECEQIHNELTLAWKVLKNFNEESTLQL